MTSAPCKADIIANEIRYSKYFVAAIGCRDVGHDELVEIIKIVRSRDTKSMRGKLSHLYKYNPDTIACDKASQEMSCPCYVDGLCDCFLPDIDKNDIFCKRKRRKYLESTDYRNTKEYKDWRISVFERDNYTCADCGERGGELNAHHIKTFKKYKSLRYEIGNGITLCVKCHRKRHSKKEVDHQVV